MRIGITMGCPVSIGPEIIARVFAGKLLPNDVSFVVLGDSGVLQKCAAESGLSVPVFSWKPGNAVRQDGVNVLELSHLAGIPWGRPDMRTGKAMGKYIETAVQLIGEGHLDGMVTCPITKSALQQAGYLFPGHTEMLASLCQTDNFGMMMAGKTLRVSLVTIHTGLADVPKMLSVERILRTIELTSETLRRDFAISQPRLGVAGFNPHAGEQGMFGREEESAIIPAIQKARSVGLNIIGPLPPDTVFHAAVRGDFDGVVCMYHDQGLIPFKLLHFADGVNITMGLPIVRTSVDHGTAYDIAGKGIADPSSLLAACRLAAEIIGNRRKCYS